MIVEAIVNYKNTDVTNQLNFLLGDKKDLLFRCRVTDDKTLKEVITPVMIGRNIYLRCNTNNPQEFYRELSKNGFNLLDSKITQDAKVKKV